MHPEGKTFFDDLLVVGFDNKGDNTGVLVVGRKDGKGGLDVVHAEKGKDAVNLYNRLVENDILKEVKKES